MKELKEILERGLEERFFQAAAFRSFDLNGTLLEVSAGECRTSSLFDIASITKVFTALIFARMKKEGRISEKVRLEDLSITGAPFEKRGITPLMLLTHTSGFPDYEPLYKIFLNESGKFGSVGGENKKEEIIDFMLRLPLAAKPSERIIYSDPGYILLGYIMEKEANASLPELLERYVTGPMGLVDTCYLPLIHYHHCETGRFVSTGHCPLKKEESIGEVWDLNCHVLGGVSGHAGLFSTGYDLERLGREFFRAYVEGESILDREELSFLMTEVRDDFGNRRRVGFDIPSGSDSLAGKHFSEESAGHLGYTGVSLWMDFKVLVGMVFLSNRVYYPSDRKKFNLIRRQVHDTAWGLIGP